MGKAQFTRNELLLKSIISFPFWLTTLYVAVVFAGHSWALYLGVLIVGWYLYTLLYWKLYQKYMMTESAGKRRAPFYFYLVVYQLLLVVLVILVSS